MEVSSASELCFHLISSSFQRCRESKTLCRLSVILKPPPPSHPSPLLRISISDTGVGNCLEEFQDIKCSANCFGLGLEKWDGMLYVRTTGIGDTEVYSYHLNLREGTSSRRLVWLPSIVKSGAIFSGTEVSLSILKSVEVLVAEFKCFFRKMLILKIPNVAIELVVEHENVPGSPGENVFLVNDSDLLSFSTSNVERLKSGLEDYVLKHGNILNQRCDSCFPNWDHLKVGSGMAHSKEMDWSSGLTMEAIIIVSEVDLRCSCSRENGFRTEILYFKDFKLGSIPQQSLNELTSIDWKSYGLSLGNAVDEGCCFMEWENLPPHTQIAMVLHCYQKQATMPLPRQKTQAGRHLIKRAVKLALDNLKEKHAGSLLSAHAVKTLSYAPDLARSIAGLILSSDDPDFQVECFSLLGLESGEIRGQTVEDCIKEKIVSVIEMHDRKSVRSKEMPTFLFEDDYSKDSNFQDLEYEQWEDEGENAFGSFDEL